MKHVVMVEEGRTGKWRTVPCECMWCVPQTYMLAGLLGTDSLNAVARWANGLSDSGAREFGRLMSR